MMSFKSLSPREAWQPLPKGEWDLAAARHLMRRISYSAVKEEVAPLGNYSPTEAVKLLLQKSKSMPVPPEVANPKETNQRLYGKVKAAQKSGDKVALKKARKETYKPQEYTRGVMVRDWFDFAQESQHRVQERLCQFLCNVVVVNDDDGFKMNYRVMHAYMEFMRKHFLGSYKVLMKDISRFPGMMQMLDLIDNTVKKPNENFARELFELFVLGEGKGYTEDDIVDAARAFTGYRFDKKKRKFYLAKKLHDNKPKTVFGKKGNWNGDKIIDMTFEQPAAQTHLIRELVHECLTHETLPEKYLEELGRQWKKNNFDLGFLFQTFFSSRLFFHPDFRGRIVKSPVQFYMSLMLDLDLDTNPLAVRMWNNLKNMGQPFLNPPDVSGFAGGEAWLNSTTLAARRVLVESIFLPFRMKSLKLIERNEVKVFEMGGKINYIVTPTVIRKIAFRNQDNALLLDSMLQYFLAVDPGDAYRKQMLAFLNAKSKKRVVREERVKRVLQAILQSPQYQLC